MQQQSSNELRIEATSAASAAATPLASARLATELAVQADEKHAHAWQAWGSMESRAGNPALARTLLTLAPL